MHPVVVAGMTKGQTIRQDVAEVRVVSDFHDVVCFKSPVSTALLAPVAIPRQDRLLPSQVLGTSTTLVLAQVLPLGNPLTSRAAVDMRQGPLTWGSDERPLTHFTSVFLLCATARMGTVDIPLHKGRGPGDSFSAGLAGLGWLAVLTHSIASTRTELLLRVGIPTAVGLLGDDLPADDTRFQQHV